MNKQRKMILIAAAAGLISVFLPWITINVFGYSQSWNGMRSWGLLSFGAFIGAGVAAFLGDQTKSMTSTYWFVALACGALAILGVLLFFLRIGNTGYGASYGFGIFIAAIAAVGVLGAAYMLRSPGATIKGGFESLKGDIEKKTDNNPNT